MKFSKAKMVERITREGRADMLDDKALAIMDKLDGKRATTSCWKRQVYGEPVLWVDLGNGEGEYVNELDCVEG